MMHFGETRLLSFYYNFFHGEKGRR